MFHGVGAWKRVEQCVYARVGARNSGEAER